MQTGKSSRGSSKNADVVLFFGGLDEISESEGLDRAHMHMPVAQDELINELTTVNKNVIVVLSAGSSVEMRGIRMSKELCTVTSAVRRVRQRCLTF